MRITNDYTKSYQPHFGDYIASEKALLYLNRTISPKKVEKANEIIAGQKGKKPNIHLHTGTFVRAGSNVPMEYLRATVGQETFKEGLFTSAFGVLKETSDYVNSLIKKKAKKS